MGLGARTAGLRRDLSEQGPAVLGRHADCTVRIPGAASAPDDAGPISRFHAVVERTADKGWCVCDSDSTNGTALLRRGLPPTVRLEAARQYPLEAGDIIELGDSPDYQFLFQAIPPAAPAASVPGTQLLARSGVRALHHLVDGHATTLREMTDGLRVARSPGGELHVASGDEHETVLRFSADARGVTVVASTNDIRLNGRPLTPGTFVALGDRDCLTSTVDTASAFVLLDPDALEPRRLSDLLLGADRVTFGTAVDNACRLSDPSVSQHHAVVWRDAGRLLVTDLGSTNGTVVNDHRIAGQTVLSPGSRLWIGRLPFVVDEACGQTQGQGDGHGRSQRPTTASVDIRFDRVSVEIGGKVRLRDLSLTIRQGEMVGVLGPSASGKSTLLRALAGQQRVAAGDILVNGRSIVHSPADSRWFEGLLGFGRDTREVGFVQQIDLLQPELTVREILQFAARQMGLPADEVRQRADRAGELCNLGTLLDRKAISSTGTMHLSGGQLKRVCVALEVLRQPRVLVLDEPTTGQDPKNTDDLMRLFRRLAQEGVTVLMSTHDLRSLAFFDKVVAVTLGHLAYFGPPEGLTRHFSTDSADEVYSLLPDREERLAEAAALAEAYKVTDLHRQLCGAGH